MRPANAARAWQCIAPSTDRCRADASAPRFAPRHSERRSVRFSSRAPPVRDRLGSGPARRRCPSAAIWSAVTAAMRSCARGQAIQHGIGSGDGCAEGLCPASRQRGRAFHRDLLSQYRRAPPARIRRRPRPRAIPAIRRTTSGQQRFLQQHGAHGIGHGAEIEQLLYAGDDRADHGRQRRRHLHIQARCRFLPCDTAIQPVCCVDGHGAPIVRGIRHFDAGDGAQLQIGQQTVARRTAAGIPTGSAGPLRCRSLPRSARGLKP